MNILRIERQTQQHLPGSRRSSRRSSSDVFIPYSIRVKVPPCPIGLARAPSGPIQTRKRRQERPLYPSADDLNASLPDMDINVNDLFTENEPRRTPSPVQGLLRAQSLPTEPLFHVGTTTRLSSSSKPVETSSEYSTVKTKRDQSPKSLKHPPTPSILDEERAENDNSSERCFDLEPRTPPRCRCFCTPLDERKRPYDDAPSEQIQVVQLPQRTQVEISPGKFMPLRGANETIAAIEEGSSKIVFCFACNSGLRCVPDCELVICPDCRIMSPVPHHPSVLMEEDEDDDSDEGYGVCSSSSSSSSSNRIPKCPPLWLENDQKPAGKQLHVTSIRGGVGLGVRA